MTSEHQSGRDRYLLPSEIHHMIESAEPGRNRMLILLLAHTGGRIDEVLRLRACDLLEDDCALRLVNLKRRAGQISTKLVAVSEDVIEAYAGYCAANNLEGTAYLFPPRPGSTNSHLSQRQARNIVYQTSRDCGLERIRLRLEEMGPVWPHLFRHSLATAWVKANIQLPVIAKQLGHSQIRSTLEYLSIDMSDQQLAVSKAGI